MKNRKWQKSIPLELAVNVRLSFEIGDFEASSLGLMEGRSLLCTRTLESLCCNWNRKSLATLITHHTPMLAWQLILSAVAVSPSLTQKTMPSCIMEQSRKRPLEWVRGLMSRPGSYMRFGLGMRGVSTSLANEWDDIYVAYAGKHDATNIIHGTTCLYMLACLRGIFLVDILRLPDINSNHDPPELLLPNGKLCI